MALASRVTSAVPTLGDRLTGTRMLRAGARFTIFCADDELARCPVVIKVPHQTSAKWLHDAIDNEARVIRAIGAHPNVIRLYEQVMLDDGRPALLLEQCTGSLEEALSGDEHIGLQRAMAMGVKIAGVLESAHGAGYLHCDVRPANVLLNAWGEPVLSGFDEAVRTEAGRTYAPRHVTTAHTAPELLQGDAASAASDVYGLASTLYELVAGRAAFRAYAGESAATVIVRVLSSPVRAIVSPHVPLELSDLLTWAMSADPAQRPPSPAWIAQELARIESHQGWPRTRVGSND